MARCFSMRRGSAQTPSYTTSLDVNRERNEAMETWQHCARHNAGRAERAGGQRTVTVLMARALEGRANAASGRPEDVSMTCSEPAASA